MVGLEGGGWYMYLKDWIDTKIQRNGPTNLVHQDAILGGLSIGQLYNNVISNAIWKTIYEFYK